MPLARLTRWLRPALTLVALAGTLALTACGGGDGAINAPNQPGPTPIPTLGTLPAGVVVAFSQVPTTVKIVGGLPPYQALSNNSAVLPVPLNVSGDTLVLVANPVTPGTDVPVDITVTDQSGQAAVVNVLVRFSPLFASGLTVTPSSSQCGTNVCDGQTATVRAVATGSGGAPLPGRQIRFDVVYGPFAILTSNPGVPVASTLTVVTDAAGVAEIQIQATANTTTQAAQIRATDITTGQSQIANFTIVRTTTADNLSVVPPVATITSATSASCSTGFVIDYYIYGGTPPYTVASTFPNGVLISPTVVTQSGGFFRAITNGTCVNPLTFTIVDSAGKVTSALLVNVPGTSTTPPVAAPTLVVTPTAVTRTGAGSCSGQTFRFILTGGTPPYNISLTPAGGVVTPPVVTASGGTVDISGLVDASGVTTVLIIDSGAPQQVRTATITCN